MSSEEKFEPILIILSKKYYQGFFRNYVSYISWEDLAQELRIQLFRKATRYDDKRPYNEWAYVVCVNALKDMIKKHKRIKRGVGLVFNWENFENIA